MTYKFLGSLVGAVALALSAGPAMAATVTVRVEGKQGTLVPATRVTLPSQAFRPDGSHDCAANSAGGALQSATAGDWQATYSSYGGVGAYLLSAIKGENPGSASGGTDYWAIYLNGKYSDNGVCDGVLQEGDDLLYYVDYCDYDAVAQTCSNAPVTPLRLTVPAGAKPGVPFTVAVADVGQDGTAAPAAGATVTGGTQPATTDAAGNATITLGAGGPATLTATKANHVRVAQAVCATTGSDGLCGTTVPATTSGTPAPAGTPAAPCVTNGRDGFCGTTDRVAANGFLSGIAEGRRFAKGKGPRQLAGRIEPDASGIGDIRVRLTRNDRGRCATYDGKREAFKAIKRCGATHGTWFSVGDRQAWTYLLPSRLGRGRYVLDLQVVDKAGNKTARLARGATRVVFTVA